MAIGTAGYTAMLCVLALEHGGITPQHGEVVVTGLRRLSHSIRFPPSWIAYWLEKFVDASSSTSMHDQFRYRLYLAPPVLAVPESAHPGTQP